jgi:hypothetical protein
MLMAAPWLTARPDWPINRFGGPCHDVMTYHIVLRLANGAFPITRLIGLRRSLARYVQDILQADPRKLILGTERRPPVTEPIGEQNRAVSLRRLSLTGPCLAVRDGTPRDGRDAKRSPRAASIHRTLRAMIS